MARLLPLGAAAAHPARTLLREGVDAAVASTWPGHGSRPPTAASTGIHVVGRLADAVQALPRADGHQAELLTILSAMACSGALFLVVEFYSPVSGLVQISPSILEGALPR